MPSPASTASARSSKITVSAASHETLLIEPRAHGDVDAGRCDDEEDERVRTLRVSEQEPADVDDETRLAGLQSGVRYADGTPKPSLGAVRTTPRGR